MLPARPTAAGGSNSRLQYPPHVAEAVAQAQVDQQIGQLGERIAALNQRERVIRERLSASRGGQNLAESPECLARRLAGLRLEAEQAQQRNAKLDRFCGEWASWVRGPCKEGYDAVAMRRKCYLEAAESMLPKYWEVANRETSTAVAGARAQLETLKQQKQEASRHLAESQRLGGELRRIQSELQEEQHDLPKLYRTLALDALRPAVDAVGTPAAAAAATAAATANEANNALLARTRLLDQTTKVLPGLAPSSSPSIEKLRLEASVSAVLDSWRKHAQQPHLHSQPSSHQINPLPEVVSPGYQSVPTGQPAPVSSSSTIPVTGLETDTAELGVLGLLNHLSAAAGSLQVGANQWAVPSAQLPGPPPPMSAVGWPGHPGWPPASFWPPVWPWMTAPASYPWPPPQQPVPEMGAVVANTAASPAPPSIAHVTIPDAVERTAGSAQTSQTPPPDVWSHSLAFAAATPDLMPAATTPLASPLSKAPMAFTPFEPVQQLQPSVAAASETPSTEASHPIVSDATTASQKPPASIASATIITGTPPVVGSMASSPVATTPPAVPSANPANTCVPHVTVPTSQKEESHTSSAQPVHQPPPPPLPVKAQESMDAPVAIAKEADAISKESQHNAPSHSLTTAKRVSQLINVFVEPLHGRPCSSTDVRRFLREANRGESWAAEPFQAVARGDMEDLMVKLERLAPAQVLAIALETLRRYTDSNDGAAEGEEALRHATQGEEALLRVLGITAADKDGELAAWQEFLAYLLSLPGTLPVGAQDALCRVVAECVLPLPRFRAEHVRRLSDTLSKLLRGFDGHSYTPQASEAGSSAAGPVVGIGAAGASAAASSNVAGRGVATAHGRGNMAADGSDSEGAPQSVTPSTPLSAATGNAVAHGRNAARPSVATLDSDSDSGDDRPRATPGAALPSPGAKAKAFSNQSAYKQRHQHAGAVASESPKKEAGHANSGGLSAYAQRKASITSSTGGLSGGQSGSFSGMEKAAAASPVAGTTSGNTAGLSAYALAKMAASGGSVGSGSASGGQSATGAQLTPAASLRKTGPGSLLSRIQNDPAWAASAGLAESEDELADLDAF